MNILSRPLPNVVCADGMAAFDVAPDYESYEFTQLDWKKPEDRKLTEDVWKWEGEFDGKPFADGKTVSCFSLPVARCKLTIRFSAAVQVDMYLRYFVESLAGHSCL